MIQKISQFIWDSCEFYHVSLGRFAPIIFGLMIGAKGKRLK